MKWSSFILTIGLKFFCIGSFAQNPFPLYTIISDTAAVLLPDSCWQMLEDDDEKFTIDQVSQFPITERFHSNTGFNDSISTYWIRFRLKNLMDHDARIVFISGAAFHDVFTAYARTPWKHQKAGWLVPWSERSGWEQINGIPVIIQPGEELIVYRRVKYDFRIIRLNALSIGFNFTDHYFRENFIIERESDFSDTVEGAVRAGLFLLTAVLSFFFFQVTRERGYVVSAVGYFFIALLSFSNSLMYALKEYPSIYYYGDEIVFHIVLFFSVLIIRFFLKTKRRFPKWDKCLIALSLLPFIAIIIKFYIFPLNVRPVILLIVFFPLILTCLILLRKRDRIAQLVIIGALPVFIYQIVEGATAIEKIDLTIPVSFQTYWFSLGFLSFFWLIVSLNRILFYQYRQLQDRLVMEELQKEQLAREKEIERSLLIEQQKVELEVQVEQRTEELRQSLNHLKSTQAQLIQSEKMASLGELTAGIAHEIQNPLNFVNNFSEVSNELLDEMKGEVDKGNYEEVRAITDDVKQNLEKVLHHGKRADAIVKGMLQHSRASSGVKEPTDINALCDEYLRLSYHGYRAKDKTFNAKFETDFDSSLPKINVVPQDVGRVVLNLINNAFYATKEKRTTNNDSYEPTVTVSTKKLNDKIEIRIKDNGSGIPQKALDKIFQPFFTTKPTGQGTGLGLSLSYDIVKAHGGEIKVKTVENQGTEFTILLSV